MTQEEALTILEQVCANTQANLSVHQRIQEALDTIKKSLTIS